MYRAHSSRLRLMPMLLVAACADAPTASELPGEPTAGATLDFTLPHLDPALLIAADTTGAGSAASEPVRVEYAEGDAPDTSLEDIPYDAMAAIYDARTSAGFGAGYGYALGQHDYQGNKSRIETTVNVSFQGQPVGSNTAFRESDTYFFFDFGLLKHIFAFSRYFTDIECGLSAWGGSHHSAWWEALPGSNTPRYGAVGLSTQSDVARQPECEPVTHADNTGGGGGGYDTGVSCWYWIVYDPYTGYIYDMELLFCEEIGG